MDATLAQQLIPGRRVTVTQQIAARDYAVLAKISGTIVEYQRKPTGSWFVNGKDDRLWLDRLTLVKDDGEITTLSLDEYSRIEVDQQAPARPR